jgi:hypothetical protein
VRGEGWRIREGKRRGVGARHEGKKGDRVKSGSDIAVAQSVVGVHEKQNGKRRPEKVRGGGDFWSWQDEVVQQQQQQQVDSSRSNNDSGPRSCCCHSSRNALVLGPGELVLLRTAAEVHGLRHALYT